MKKKMLSMFVFLCEMSSMVFANEMTTPVNVKYLNGGIMVRILNLVQILIFLGVFILVIDTIKKYRVLKKKANSEGNKMKYGFLIWNIVLMFILYFLSLISRPLPTDF